MLLLLDELLLLLLLNELLTLLVLQLLLLRRTLLLLLLLVMLALLVLRLLPGLRISLLMHLVLPFLLALRLSRRFADGLADALLCRFDDIPLPLNGPLGLRRFAPLYRCAGLTRLPVIGPVPLLLTVLDVGILLAWDILLARRIRLCGRIASRLAILEAGIPVRV